MHYCLGELADIGILSKAEVCSFEELFGNISDIDGCEVKNKSCCGQEDHLISGQEHNTTLKSQLKVKSEKVLSNTFTSLPLIFSYKTVSNRTYQSPLSAEPPLFLLVQSFRL